jgi:valyl-tRNA synthetase
MARLNSVEWLGDAQQAPESATALVGDMKILIPLAGLIDKEAEISRLEREIGKASGDFENCERKLSNEQFVARAPAAVVAKERKRLAESRSALDNLQEQLGRMQKL